MATTVPHDEREQVHAETIAEWRRWLEENHTRADGVWLVSWRAPTGRPRMTYEESVEEALAFGWIDSKARTLDEERTTIWMSPGQPTHEIAELSRQPTRAQTVMTTFPRARIVSR